MRAGARAIDLVDDEDRVQARGKCLAGHEARLWHRALYRIDHEQHRVDHGQDSLDLTAEVGMPGGVHDVDAAARMLDRGRLGQDGDAAFAFQLIAVERPIGDLLARIGRGVLQQSVHERGLAVVDVSDDGDVADFHGVRRARREAPGRGARARESNRSETEAVAVPPGAP